FVTMHPVEDLVEPARAFATRRTPPARLVFVKMGDVARRLEDVGGLVHDDHAARAEHRPCGGDRLVIERDFLALFGGQDRNRRAAWDACFEPAAPAQASALR